MTSKLRYLNPSSCTKFLIVATPIVIAIVILEILFVNKITAEVIDDIDQIIEEQEGSIDYISSILDSPDIHSLLTTAVNSSGKILRINASELISILLGAGTISTFIGILLNDIRKSPILSRDCLIKTVLTIFDIIGIVVALYNAQGFLANLIN